MAQTLRWFILVLAALHGQRAFACCQGPLNAEPYTVVATVGMIADIVSNVAGSHADVTSLMEAGIDPHLYKPTRSDVRMLLQADIIFYNGLLLEGKMTGTLERAAASGKTVCAVTEHLEEHYLIEPEGASGHHDPHVWMDPVAWMSAVEVVRDTLIEFDPASADDYTKNASAYIEKVQQLNEYASTILKSVPERQRVLVTAHDAFNYFGQRFGFQVVGIQGLSTESEAGVRDIERLVDLIVDRNIKAVFIESTVSERNIKALIAGAKARGRTLIIGGELYSDAMGPGGTYEGTYIGMIDHNVTIITRGLGGEAPERGMNGSLAE